jgi:hypothetical protein
MMKNPFNRLVHSSHNLWKISGLPHSLKDGASQPSLASPRYSTFPTKIVKDFVECVAKKSDPVVLDIGSVVGSNIEYLMNFGIKVYMEDLLAAYDKPKYLVTVDEKLTFDEHAFFSENFGYEDCCFDGLICWDILDYLDARFAKAFIAQISAKMKPGGLVLGFFHTQKGIGPCFNHKYRLVDGCTLEYIPLERKMELKKIYPSREINQLFSGYKNQRFYLLKNNFLEVMLRKT